MNKTILRGKWRRLQGNLKSEWGRLTDNDRRILDGKIDQMVGLFQERYGYTQERATQAVTHYLGRYENKKVHVPSTFTPPWVPLAVASVLLSVVALGWFITNQLVRAATDFADDNEVEAALEEALAASEAL